MGTRLGKVAQLLRNHRLAIPVAAVFVSVSYLSLVRLDNTPFWDDEADAAIVARNFLATGTVTGWDGRNLLSCRNGQTLDQDLNFLNPPLDCVVIAASFRLFGQTTWAGRFPFVIAGLLSLAIFGVIVHRDFRDQPALWLYALAGLGLSVVFLLSIRQCRYYSLGMLAVLLGLDAYRRCLARGRVAHYLVFAAAMIALFYASFLYCVAFLGALGVVHVMFHRRELKRKDLWKPALALVCIALAIAPYAIQRQIWHRPDIMLGESWLFRGPILLWWNLRELNILGLPWMVAAALVVIFVLTWRRDKNLRRVLEYAVLTLGYVLFVALLSPQPVGTVVKTADVRYLFPVVPFLAVLVAAVLYAVHQRAPRIAVALLIILLTTNTFSAHPWGWKTRWLLPAYIEEVHHDYPTAYAQVISYLRQNTQKDDLVFAWPEYTNYPILFYLGDHIKIGCLLNRDTPLPMEKVEQMERAGARLLIERHFPDWIVLFGTHPQWRDLVTGFSRPHLRGDKIVRMDYRPATSLDVYWGVTYRPEIHLHRFRPTRDFDRVTKGVHILKGTLVSPTTETTPATALAD